MNQKIIEKQQHLHYCLLQAFPIHFPYLPTEETKTNTLLDMIRPWTEVKLGESNSRFTEEFGLLDILGKLYYFPAYLFNAVEEEYYQLDLMHILGGRTYWDSKALLTLLTLEQQKCVRGTLDLFREQLIAVKDRDNEGWLWQYFQSWNDVSIRNINKVENYLDDIWN